MRAEDARTLFGLVHPEVMYAVARNRESDKEWNGLRRTARVPKSAETCITEAYDSENGSPRKFRLEPVTASRRALTESPIRSEFTVAFHVKTWKSSKTNKELHLWLHQILRGNKDKISVVERHDQLFVVRNVEAFDRIYIQIRKMGWFHP